MTNVASRKLPDHLPPPGADGMWGLLQIAEAAGVTRDAVYKWRNRFMQDQRTGRAPSTGSLLAPDGECDPGFGYGQNNSFPRWDPWRAIRWLQQTGRMDENFQPVRLTQRSKDTPGSRREDGTLRKAA